MTAGHGASRCLASVTFVAGASRLLADTCHAMVSGIRCAALSVSRSFRWPSQWPDCCNTRVGQGDRLREKIVNVQIEKLKRDIAADAKSAAILEIEELASRLEDLSRHVNCTRKPNADVDAFFESTMRSYWGAMILARKAIDKADQYRQMANAQIRHSDQVTSRL